VKNEARPLWPGSLAGKPSRLALSMGRTGRLTLDLGFFRELRWRSLGIECGSCGPKGRAPKGLNDSARGFNQVEYVFSAVFESFSSSSSVGDEAICQGGEGLNGEGNPREIRLYQPDEKQPRTTTTTRTRTIRK
jgi:hypothetical protein